MSVIQMGTQGIYLPETGNPITGQPKPFPPPSIPGATVYCPPGMVPPSTYPTVVPANNYPVMPPSYTVPGMVPGVYGGGAYGAYGSRYNGAMVIPRPVITSNGVSIELGRTPLRLNCPHCKEDIVTKMRYEIGMLNHIAAGITCMFLCVPCVWIPYVISSLKDVSHECPSCGRSIGRYQTARYC